MPTPNRDQIERITRRQVFQRPHDAGLHHGLRENRVDGLRKTPQPIDDGNQDVTDAAALEFVHDAQPELGAFGLFDPQTQNIFGAVRQDAQRDVDRLVA
jgi:hypothetical protein